MLLGPAACVQKRVDPNGNFGLTATFGNYLRAFQEKRVKAVENVFPFFGKIGTEHGAGMDAFLELKLFSKR